jgi:hypothetical protein
MYRWLTAVLTVAVLTLAAPDPARAQATPEGEVIGIEGCTVEPIDVEAVLNTLVATPASEAASPIADDATATPPSGEPADEEIVAGVEETVRQFVACTNAVDRARLYGLFSPEWFILVSGLSPNDVPEPALIPTIAARVETRLAGATPVAEEDLTGLVEIRDVVVLDDGRVAATVVTDGPEGAGESLFIFLEQDGVFLVDFVGDLVGDGTPAA